MKSIDEFKKSVYAKADEQNRIRAEKMKVTRKILYTAAMLCIVLLSAFAVKQAQLFKGQEIATSDSGSFITSTTPIYTSLTTTPARTMQTSTTATSHVPESTEVRTNEYIIGIDGEVDTDYAISVKSIDEYVSWAIIDSGLSLPDLNTVLDISKNWENEAFFKNNICGVLVCMIKNTDNSSPEDVSIEYVSDGDTAIIYYDVSCETSFSGDAPAGFIIVKEYPYDFENVATSNANSNS